MEKNLVSLSIVNKRVPYYLIAELDWDDMESLKRAFQSPEGKATAHDVEELSKLSPGVHSMIYELEEV